MQTEIENKSPTLDPGEVEKFGAMAAEWWNPSGKFRPLHKIGPSRLAYFRREICAHFGRDVNDDAALSDLRLIDIGCGGGLVAEPMSKQGAIVTGIDPSDNNIKAAALHADQQGLKIDYRACRAEDVAEKGETFDIVLVLEVVEHVPKVPDFVKLVSSLVAPGGLIILSTINRTTKSFALAIVGAEFILRWLPKGTHQWNRFVTPDELKSALQAADLKPRNIAGLEYNPFSTNWSITSNSDVNYFLTASRD